MYRLVFFLDGPPTYRDSPKARTVRSLFFETAKTLILYLDRRLFIPSDSFRKNAAILQTAAASLTLPKVDPALRAPSHECQLDARVMISGWRGPGGPVGVCKAGPFMQMHILK